MLWKKADSEYFSVWFGRITGRMLVMNTSMKTSSLSRVQNTKLLHRGNLLFLLHIASGQQNVGMAAKALTTSVAFIVTSSWH